MEKLIKFKKISKNEKVEMFLRKHWIVFLKLIFMYSMIVIIPFILYIIAKLNNATDNISNPVKAVVLMCVSIFYILIAIFFLVSWIDSYLDVLIITNKRIINIRQIGLWGRIVSEHRIDKVQDVTSEVCGMINTFFHCGDIIIQTAGEKEQFHFEKVLHPEELTEKIMELVRK